MGFLGQRALGWIVVANAGLGAAAALLGSCTPDRPAPRENTAQVQQAATGVCDSNPPSSTLACINAVQNNASVVNDIFKDSNGLTGPQLPTFGKLFNQWPNCPDATDFAGCAGQSLPPYDCPGQYTCLGKPNNFATASQHLNALDRLWWHPCRLANPNLVNGCPQYGCIGDGVGGNYLPWEGLVFDLGGPSNKVAIFAQNDHGPQPCESLEYTVYLTDNPMSHEAIQDPKNTGVDPKKWNRAVLSKIFTKGWVEVRPPDPAGHAFCGDTAQYSVEEDSFAQVFSLPCGITFRYAAIIAGNDGLDFPACAFDSQEAELDAVAGLTEQGSGVCPDKDLDHYVDCKCPNAPKVCDCDDNAALIHPNAPEPCDSVDVNCDGLPGACENPLVCNASICVAKCDGEAVACPKGASCTSTPNGKLCVPGDCSVGGCPAGSVCNAMKVCVPACDGVVCPGKQVCQDGHCIDPCLGVDCPPGHFCQVGKCQAPCNCFAGDAGCVDEPGTVCDSGATNLCTPPACKGKMCPPGQQCDANGNCVGFCNMNVKCPTGQKCVEPTGCVPLCESVNCDAGTVCNPDTGKCEDHSCDGVICFDNQVCQKGVCQDVMGASASASGASSSGAGGPAVMSPEVESGCGCRVVGRRDPGAAAIMALVACAALASRRRPTA
jgi:hypothetical protein